MQLFTLFVLLLISSNLSAADKIYQSVDKDGNIIFTDRPTPNSKQIKLKEPVTISNPTRPEYVLPKPKTSDLSKAKIRYQSLLVTNPADGSALRNNAGNFSISVFLQPSLRPGHKMVIMLDDQEVSSGNSLNVSLNNIDRGTHTISATVIDAQGQSLITSSSRFTLLRAHR